MTRGTLEDGREMGIRISGIFCQIVQCDGLLYILLHIFQGSIDDAMCLVIILFLSLVEFPVLWHIAQRTEIEMQER